MSRDEQRVISHRLTRILRYELVERGLAADSEGFVSFQDVCRHCDRHSPSVVYQAALNSKGRNGQRFEVRGDNTHGWFIRPRHQVGHRQRSALQEPPVHQGIARLELEGAHQSSRKSARSSWEHTASSRQHDEGRCNVVEGVDDEEFAELLQFLKAAFTWLSGQVEVPDTQSLQHFVGNWKAIENRPAVVSDDPHRQNCLRFVEWQIEALHGHSGMGDPDDPWYNWHLPDFLGKWEIEDYHETWQMSWQQVEALFWRGQHSE